MTLLVFVNMKIMFYVCNQERHRTLHLCFSLDKVHKMVLGFLFYASFDFFFHLTYVCKVGKKKETPLFISILIIVQK